MTGILIRKPCEDTPKGDEHVKMKAETGIMHQPAKKLQVSSNHQKLRRAKERTLPQIFRGNLTLMKT